MTGRGFFCTAAARPAAAIAWNICAGILRGAGKTMIPMAVTLGAWCALRIVYIEGLVRIFEDIRVVFTAYPVTWSVSTIVLIWFVLRQNWEKNTLNTVKVG